LITLFLLHRYRHHRALHSFPTRRSTDLSSAAVTGDRSALVRASSARARAARMAAAAADTMVVSSSSSRRSATRRSSAGTPGSCRSEEHTSELQSRGHLVCRLLLEKKKKL